jgi:hypothetical protein
MSGNLIKLYPQYNKHLDQPGKTGTDSNGNFSGHISKPPVNTSFDPKLQQDINQIKDTFCKI